MRETLNSCKSHREPTKIRRIKNATQYTANKKDKYFFFLFSESHQKQRLHTKIKCVKNWIVFVLKIKTFREIFESVSFSHRNLNVVGVLSTEQKKLAFFAMRE